MLVTKLIIKLFWIKKIKQKRQLNKINKRAINGMNHTLLILGTTDRRAKSLWLSFCRRFLSETTFFEEAGEVAAPSGELESPEPENGSSKGQLNHLKQNLI